jgi:hypothetical protein
MDDPVLSIKRGMKVYINFGLKNPDFYKLAFLYTPDFKTEDYMVEGLYGTKTYMNLRSLVEVCIQKGLFMDIDVDLAAQVLWSMNHGIASLLITNPRFPWADRDTLISAAIDRAVAGFLQ